MASSTISEEQASMERKVKQAIEGRIRLHVLYGGMLRLVETYACGYSGRGETLLFAPARR